MKTIKVSEATNLQLDWMVAKCEGELPASYNDWRQTWPHYSTNWAQGGPIIDSILGLVQKTWLESKPESKCEAHIHNCDGNWIAFGPTPLIAAMRCLVTAELGDTVEVPEELT